MSVGLRDIVAFSRRELPVRADSRGQLSRESLTTAHLAGLRFYRDLHRPSRGISVLEVIARAPSPWAIRTLLEDASRFTSADRRTRERWRRTARARLATLQGEVLAPVELDQPRFPWEGR